MLVVAAKAGFVFALTLSMIGVVQTEPVAEPLLQFAAAGLIPGTTIVVSPNAALIAASIAFVVLTGFLIYQYVAYRSALTFYLAEYRAEQDGVDLVPLSPGLASLIIAASRSLTTKANEAPLQLYFWLRSFGQMITAKAMLDRDRVSVIRMNHLARNATTRPRPLYNPQTLRFSLNNWTHKAKMYLVKLSLS
jgi:hypothetical protein